MQWQRGGETLLYGMYDPPVRYRDRYRPNTTAPVQRIAPGIAGARATLSFTGRDLAWIAGRGPTHGRAKVCLDGPW